MATASIIQVSHSGTTAVLAVPHPIITADQADQLAQEFTQAVASLPATVTTVHLDVHQVLGLSSGGFAALLTLKRTCQSRNMALTVSQLQPTFHRLLERLGFLRLLGLKE